MNWPANRDRWWSVLALVAGLAIATAMIERRHGEPAPIMIAFDGLHAITDPAYPYGLFTITNNSSRQVRWEAVVEAPLDPQFEWQQGLSSFRGGGVLASGAKTHFPMLVAGKRGVRFRLVVTLIKSPSLPVRLWLAASETLPALQWLWHPAKAKTRRIFGEWQTVPTNRWPPAADPPGSQASGTTRSDGN